MKYRGKIIRSDIEITKIYTVHYFEFSKDYAFYGESHNFWEFVYVDKGEITAVAGDKEFTIGRGDIIFHKPNEWHNLIAKGTVAPNIIIVSFASSSEAMKFFENKVLKIGHFEKSFISEIINEYTGAFSTPTGDIFTNYLTRRKKQKFGSEQMIKIYLEMLLISMFRGTDISQQSITKSRNMNKTLRLVLGYMENNLSGEFALKDVAKYAGMSKSAVSAMFRQYFSSGVTEYFINMKIEAAKRYIREGNYNFTQIAEMLGYSGIHYFSRQFKKVTGMSPTEYAQSLKALLETVKAGEK
ncbi:MAG: AraC family transcriptional regulator [Bacillota bacterium]|nr:AraC family transcriptional regulator [Bacillota bacterium]